MEPFLPDFELPDYANTTNHTTPVSWFVAEEVVPYAKAPEDIFNNRRMVVMHSIAGLQLTRHALKRLAQRQISAQMVADTIKHGLKLCKQGLCFYVLTQRIAAKTFARPYAERIANTVVIVKRPDCLLTAYKNSRAVRTIQKKPKRLMR